MKTDYFIGLDLGTNSVGWAATDKDYRLIRAKGKNLIGFRLFDEAETAAEKRVHRSSRRRLHRANSRLKLLCLLFRDEIAKVDPNFYLRLKESFYFAEDKHGLNHDKNTLFADSNYTDKDFHRQFPTIWHLRKALIDGKQKYDIRFYFLAIQHILKHRGHFLFGGEIKDLNHSFDQLYQELIENSNNYLTLDPIKADNFQSILTAPGSKTDKKKLIGNTIIVSFDPESIDEKLFSSLFVGSEVSFKKLFKLDADEDKKSSFNDSKVDEKLDDLTASIDADQFDLIITAKKIYDFGILKNLLAGSSSISEAMVKNYHRHQAELKALKDVLKPYPTYYAQLFKSTDKKSYNAYIGKAPTGNRISQEDFNKHLVNIFTEISYQGKLLPLAENRTLFPKQKGQAKGSIPMQLHQNELKIILQHLERDYPSFAAKNTHEPEKYNTISKKIFSIHAFRIPYYCGPLVKRKFDDQGNLISDGKSEFSWADEEIRQIVYPWNFSELVNLEQRATNFIRRMTNECTYLRGEEVLPKSSLIYQKFLVLNELNNLKLNHNRISDISIKQKIFDQFFYQPTAPNSNFKLGALKKILTSAAIINKTDELGGTNQDKYLPRLSTHLFFSNILGSDYLQHYQSNKLEQAIETITILDEEKSMCSSKLQQILGCDQAIAGKLCRLSCKGWGNLSAKLLTGLKFNLNGTPTTVLDALYDTNYNFMELLSLGLGEAIEKYNDTNLAPSTNITYDQVKNLYCSPVVKRTIWQAVKIVEELVATIGYPPKKIFIEVTRNHEDVKTKQQRAKLRARRKDQLLATLKTSKELAAELVGTPDEKLQSKKLYLYFMQHGRCAYTGARLLLDDLNGCDIDHIYPRSLTKDDSLTNNLVLVLSEYNREKTNAYPINTDWRTKMHDTWLGWLKSGSITKEKFFRLTRNTSLTTEELGSFIARQLVETSQATKAIYTLFSQHYQNTTVVTVKANHVSDFRHFLGFDKKNRAGEVYHLGRPEFIKIRELNDLHHAKDAYLNIIVGNVYHETFTDNPTKWIKDKANTEYTLNTDKLFRESESYRRLLDNELTTNPKVKAWNFANSIAIASKVMQQNGVLWTRMPITQSGEISDLQPVSKSKDRLPLKQTKRLADTEKYGGYNSLKGAYFCLIDFANKKGTARKIVQIPIIYQGSPEKYLSKLYQNPRILIPKILIKSLFEVNGMPLHLTGRTGDSIVFTHAKQLWLDKKFLLNLKKLLKISENIKFYRKNNKTYRIPQAYEIDKNLVVEIYQTLIKKLQDYKNTPTLGGKIPEITSNQSAFTELGISDQCEFISELLNIFTCNAKSSNLSKLIDKSSSIAGNVIRTSSDLKNLASIKLIHQSPTGLTIKVIDLKNLS